MAYVLGWAFIGIGILVGATRLVRLAKSRATPGTKMSRKRSLEWLDVAGCATPVAVGVNYLGDAAKIYVLVWAVWCVSFLALSIATFRYVQPARNRPRSVSDKV